MAEYALSSLNEIDAALRDTAKPWHSLFAWAEERSGISRLKLFFGIVCATCMFLIPGSMSAMLVSDVLGFAYPAYATIVLMMDSVGQLPSGVASSPTNGSESVSPANRWFTYWLLLAATLTVQQLCGGLLRLVPFYCLMKTAFFAWCAAPIEANGAAYVYVVVVRRFFNQGR
ncbi:unnamed protein product [Macrosiphum euphorbiae]|uniref:Receptor expression-enhancing protein n=1 Tax=Macrosiphum euphorbiae TaxID=13131 RepID=A0AAV0W0M6_9HEMI|nr:unnamed protein product [Macrosiphum euphorbiae]